MSILNKMPHILVLKIIRDGRAPSQVKQGFIDKAIAKLIVSTM